MATASCARTPRRGAPGSIGGAMQAISRVEQHKCGERKPRASKQRVTSTPIESGALIEPRSPRPPVRDPSAGGCRLRDDDRSTVDENIDHGGDGDGIIEDQDPVSALAGGCARSPLVVDRVVQCFAEWWSRGNTSREQMTSRRLAMPGLCLTSMSRSQGAPGRDDPVSRSGNSQPRQAKHRGRGRPLVSSEGRSRQR